MPTLLVPASNALTTDFSPSLNWSMPATSPVYDHFIVQVDNNSDFSSPEYEKQNVVAPPFSPLTDLAANTKFYWRVRGANGSELGNWSAVRYFRTALQPAGLISPADNVTVDSLRPTFDWGDVSGATGYTIQISKNDLFTMIVHTGNPTSSQYTPSVDLPKSSVAPVLYWRVQVKGTNGPSAWSPTVATDRSFSTPLNPPGVPTLLVPASNALITDYLPTFTWRVPAGTVYHHFLLQVDNNSDFSSPEIDIADTSLTTTNFTPGSNLASNTKWYWRVRAVNAGNEMSPWSTGYFRAAMEIPVLIAPTDNYTVATFFPVFDWTNVVGATGYNIQISKNITFTQIVINANTTSSAYQPVKIYCSATYYWRVRATGPNGPSSWSALRSYIAPSCP